MGGSDFAGAVVAEDVPLASLTTLRVGPVARRVITCSSTEQVVATLRAFDHQCGAGHRVLVLAGGSNVVIADDLAALTVVQLANTEITVAGNRIRAEAGAAWDDVVVTALAHGLGGLECLSGIPGSAGATPVQNVGAYGVEVADRLAGVRVLDRRSGEVRSMSPAELGFGYRSSVLKRSPATAASEALVVLDVEFQLNAAGRSAPLRYGELVTALGSEPGARADPARVRDAVLTLRTGKGMVLDDADHDTWSVGSFFTNPVVPAPDFDRLRARLAPDVPHWPTADGVKLAAGWLVERAGFAKGYPGDSAPVRLSTKHALALTNRGNATTADVIELARTVRDGVREAFGIALTPEPVLVGVTI